MISKKLLSEVLGEKLSVFFPGYLTFNAAGDYLQYQPANASDGAKCVNIYKLMYLCKQWALSKGFVIESAHFKESYAVVKEFPSGIEEKFYAETEPQAVFKATEWIFEQIK